MNTFNSANYTFIKSLITIFDKNNTLLNHMNLSGNKKNSLKLRKITLRCE